MGLDDELGVVAREVNAELDKLDAVLLRRVARVRLLCALAAAIGTVTTVRWFATGRGWRWWAVAELILIFVTVVFVVGAGWFERRIEAERKARHIRLRL